MATKMARICGSVTLTSAAVIRVKTFGGTVNTDVSIPSGRYWFDPLLPVTSGTVGAWQAFANLLDTGDTHSTYTVDIAYVAATGWVCDIIASGSNFNVMTTSATTNTQGKRFLRMLGADQVSDSGTLTTMVLSHPTWSPQRGESTDVDQRWRGFAVSVETEGGTVYTADLGAPLGGRMITLKAVAAYEVKQRYTGATTDNNAAIFGDLSFESLLWLPQLSRGELFRYYADENATLNTYTTAAMTTTSSTVVVGSVTGLAASPSSPCRICIDGEFMTVTAINGGTKTLTVARRDPVAHSAYAPVSTDFCGTYALAPSGGNVNLQQCEPERRGDADDRWDVTIACTPASW